MLVRSVMRLSFHTDQQRPALVVTGAGLAVLGGRRNSDWAAGLTFSSQSSVSLQPGPADL